MAQRILVVDDTPQNVKLLGDLLTAKGYGSRPPPAASLRSQASRSSRRISCSSTS